MCNIKLEFAKKLSQLNFMCGLCFEFLWNRHYCKRIFLLEEKYNLINIFIWIQCVWFKTIFFVSGESDVNLIDFDENSLRQKLTDRQHGNDFIGEVEDSRKKLEQYIKAVDREITKRRQVKDLLEQARKYYASLQEEASIVANVSCDVI